MIVMMLKMEVVVKMRTVVLITMATQKGTLPNSFSLQNFLMDQM